jgi:hypothetical protein
MNNERLRSGLRAAGLTPVALAERLDVDPKTVHRWIGSGRLPYPSHRLKVAELLQVDEAYLWPELLSEQRTRAASSSELLEFFPTRGAVPADLWRGIVARAGEAVDLLVYAGLFWFDSYPDLVPTLASKATDESVIVRLLLGDPDSLAVQQRSAEEGTDIAARCRMTLGLITPLLDVPGIEVRLHDTTLYASMYRADDTLLVNAHTFGAPASHSPVLRIQRLDGGRLFAHYLESFDKVWARARPHRAAA